MIGSELFLLGVACGLTVLPITTYRRVSPLWLRWLLIGAGLLVITQYIARALLLTPEGLQKFWDFRYFLFSTTVGLSLPTVFAIDGLIRHPAITPQKLLKWTLPWLLIEGTILIIGAGVTKIQILSPDSTLHFHPLWQWALAIGQGLFSLTGILFCGLLIQKISSSPIRCALLGLALGHTGFGLAHILLAAQIGSVNSLVFCELFLLLALWHAYETAFFS